MKKSVLNQYQRVSQQLQITSVIVMQVCRWSLFVYGIKMTHRRTKSMTRNQLTYQANLETARSNRAREAEDRRVHNMSTIVNGITNAIGSVGSLLRGAGSFTRSRSPQAATTSNHSNQQPRLGDAMLSFFTNSRR
nr:putative ORF1 [Marmot picobirnavirus]